jgi:hypothetical protein
MDHPTIVSLTGPALSEAVAAHAMGWQRLCQAPIVNNMGSVWADEKNNWYLIPRRPVSERDAGLFGIVAKVWEPLRDIRAAWEVFMAAPGDTKTLQVRDNRFFACIDEGDLVEAASPEVAVCRASLFAVLAPVGAVGAGASVSE